MKTFTVDKNTTIVCESQRTRSGFRHLATLVRNNCEVDTTKVCYQNRTWERYDFETVLHKLLTKHYDAKKTATLLDKWGGISSEETKATHRIVGTIALMGEMMTSSKKESNDWKARMLKAGLPGLDIPEDWETLDETEKTRRLDAVIAMVR